MSGSNSSDTIGEIDNCKQAWARVNKLKKSIKDLKLKLSEKEEQCSNLKNTIIFLGTSLIVYFSAFYPKESC